MPTDQTPLELLLAAMLAKLAEIEKTCRRFYNPGVNVGANLLAAKVIAIIEREEAA